MKSVIWENITDDDLPLDIFLTEGIEEICVSGKSINIKEINGIKTIVIESKNLNQEEFEYMMGFKSGIM